MDALEAFPMKHGEIHLKNETLAVLPHYLVSRGVSLPPGAVKNSRGVSVTEAKRRVLPSEGRGLQRRPDGSVEWMLMDILVPLGGQEAKSIFIEPHAAKQLKAKHEVAVKDDGARVTLSNGISAITVNRGGGSLIHKLVINGHVLVAEGTVVDLEVADGGGKIHRASLSGSYKVTIPHRNRHLVRSA